MKLLVSVVATNDQVAKIVVPSTEGAIINPTQLFMDQDSGQAETADYSNQALAWFATQPAPAFHEELEAWWTIQFTGDEYGIVHGVMTSAGNVIIKGYCDDDGETTTVFLGYQGTRGRLLEIQSVVGVRLTEFFGEEVEVYETTGPSDMLWYEDKSTYVIRTGKYEETIKQILDDLNPSSMDVGWVPFIWDMSCEHQYRINRMGFIMNTNDETIFMHWLFADKLKTSERMEKVRAVVQLKQLLHREMSAIS